MTTKENTNTSVSNANTDMTVSKNKSDQNNAVTYISWTLRNMPVFISKQRYLAYASEAGESFRPIIPKYLVNATYGLSLAYVGADTYTKAVDIYNATGDKKKTLVKTTDTLLWHSMASMIFPGVTIHSIVKYSDKGLSKFNHKQVFTKFPKVRGWLPTVIGLASIPFVVHPLDHITDYIMDNTTRKLPFFKV